MTARPRLFWYQVLTALSDGGTGIALVVAPLLTLRLMGMAADAEAAPYLRYLGAFVLSTGMACAWGAWCVRAGRASSEVATVWCLTAITRTLVAVCVLAQVVAHALDPHWTTVAVFDGALALVQWVGLAKGWPARALGD